MKPLQFAILAIATYRLSVLIAFERGPYNALAKFRELTGVVLNEVGDEQTGTNELSRAVICPLCNSLWIGLLITAMFYISPKLTQAIAMPFALSGVTVIIENNNNG